MTRLLLDTHALLWWDTGDSSLGPRARKAIEHAAVVFVSAASEWEIAIKAGLGKVALPRTIEEAADDAGFELLPVSFAHARAVRGLPPIHRDPFDRLLIAAARVEGLSVVTADEIFEHYKVPLVYARN